MALPPLVGIVLVHTHITNEAWGGAAPLDPPRGLRDQVRRRRDDARDGMDVFSPVVITRQGMEMSSMVVVFFLFSLTIVERARLL